VYTLSVKTITGVKKMKKTVIGVIGAGRIAKNAHLPALSKMENIRLKYLCDILPEKAQALKDKYSCVENVTSDYMQVLNDKEVEAVFVLTPNRQHYEIGMKALKMGKHVFCEKPIANTYALAKEMADEAKKQDKILNIGVCNRYNRAVETLHDYVKDGKFGDIYHVYCSFRGFRCIPGLGGAFTNKKESGGGVLIDWGVHFFDIILYVLGGAKIETVTCDCYLKMAKDMKEYRYKDMWAENTSNIENGVNDVDDFVSGYIRTDKASISFNGAWAQNIDANDMYIDFLGDKAGARLTYGGKFTFTDGKTLETVTPEYEWKDHFLEEDTAFINSIRTGKKCKNHVDEVLETAKLIEGLYKSSNEKREILGKEI